MATIHKLQTISDRKTKKLRQDARLLLDNLAQAGILDATAIAPAIAALDAHTASENGWTFIMLGPAQNAAVATWLADNSKRPKAAMKLWATLFTGLRMDTGEIMLTRTKIADQIGIKPFDVSRIMTDLEKIGAISRRYEGRAVRYFMNPNVGTCLKGAARDRAQTEAPQLTVV